MFCSKCGEEIKDKTAEYCQKCGKKLTVSRLDKVKSELGNSDKKKKDTSIPTTDIDNKLVGIKNWFALFTFGLIISSIYSGYNALSYLSQSQDSSIADYSGEFIFLSLAFAVLCILEVITLIKIFKKRSSAKKIFGWVLGMGILVYFLDSAIVSDIYSRAGVTAPDDLYYGAFRAILYALTWGIYFYKSKRVKATLVG
jgi:hypothetical protein